MTKRCMILPAEGTLLVSTDLHGSGVDFDRMRQLFIGSTKQTHWVILGDVVHAPSRSARERRPDLYSYEDESGRIAKEIGELRREYPGRVHFVLGNHDWAHIGGPRVSKFFDDEAKELESKLAGEVIDAMHELFRDALLCVVAPCGAFLAHASPGALFDSVEEIDAIDLSVELSDRQRGLVRELTTFYGQREAVSRSFLEQMSYLTGLDLRFLCHGHDRDEEGWFVHEETQICTVFFGAPRENKRYLRLDLGARYDSVHALREGHEIARLWEEE